MCRRRGGARPFEATFEADRAKYKKSRHFVAPLAEAALRVLGQGFRRSGGRKKAKINGSMSTREIEVSITTIMGILDIANRRLHNQCLAWQDCSRVRGEMAGQPSNPGLRRRQMGARAAFARRTDADVEQAFAEGSILRTHLLRPTWHFVTPGDIRWVLALTAPRVNAANAYYYRKLELDQTTFRRSHAALVRALQGGQQLTREQLRGVLRQAGIAAEGSLRMGYIMMRAELDGIVCSGARRGKQFTYALLDERVPQTKTLGRDEALAELAGVTCGHGQPRCKISLVVRIDLADARAASHGQSPNRQEISTVRSNGSDLHATQQAYISDGLLRTNYDEY